MWAGGGEEERTRDTHARARANARTHAHTHTHTHARTHTHTHTICTVAYLVGGRDVDAGLAARPADVSAARASESTSLIRMTSLSE
jgi:ABC-type Zn2+ transport system substrate-binding protein/surface adhesin